jgi:hypothetical protein
LVFFGSTGNRSPLAFWKPEKFRGPVAGEACTYQKLIDLLLLILKGSQHEVLKIPWTNVDTAVLCQPVAW